MILYTYLAVSTASNACTALNPKLTSPHKMKAIYIKLKSLSYARPLPSTIGAIYKNSSELRSLFTCSIDAQTIVMYGTSIGLSIQLVQVVHDQIVLLQILQ